MQSLLPLYTCFTTLLTHLPSGRKVSISLSIDVIDDRSFLESYKELILTSKSLIGDSFAMSSIEEGAIIHPK
jgi:hypothetical protein